MCYGIWGIVSWYEMIPILYWQQILAPYKMCSFMAFYPKFFINKSLNIFTAKFRKYRYCPFRQHIFMTFKKPTFKLESKNHQPLQEIHEKHKFLLILFKGDCSTIHVRASHYH